MKPALHTSNSSSTAFGKNGSEQGNHLHSFRLSSNGSIQNRRDLKVISKKKKALQTTYGISGFTPLYQQGLTTLLQSEFKNIQIASSPFCKIDLIELTSTERLDLIIIDLGIEQSSQLAKIRASLKCFESLIHHTTKHSSPILVMSENIYPLARYKSHLLCCGKGFGIASKADSFKKIKQMISLIQEGAVIWPQELRDSPISNSISPTLERLLELKFISGLTDIAIANQLDISSRTVRSYWVQLQQAFGIEKDPELDLSIQIMNAAQKYGFLSWE